MRFTFARSNAAKLLRLPLYVVAGILALCFPRRRMLWVFGRKTGVGEGPLRLLREAQAAYPELRAVWIAQDEIQLREARSLDLEAYLVTSWRARWLTLRAGAGVVTHGLGDLCRPFVPGMYLVQLWHGSPLKRIHLDAPRVQQTRLGGSVGRLAAIVVTGMFRASASFIRCVPAPSALVASRFQSAWGWLNDERVRVTGDPRCDVLLEGSPAERRMEATALLQAIWRVPRMPGRLLLFAPTWRDGEADPSLPGATDWARINAVLEALDAWLVVRSHPWGVAAKDLPPPGSTARIRFLPSSHLHDVNRVLNAFDLLITDYSAIAMDYSLLERPILFFAPDLEAYERSRGLYEDYARFTQGRWQTDWDGVAGAIERTFADNASYTEAIDQSAAPLLGRYHYHRDANSASRVLAEIESDLRLAQARSPA